MRTRLLGTLAGKDLRLLARDRMALFWAFGFPLLMSLFFGSIASGGGSGRARLSVGIDDQDGSAASKALVARLEGHQLLRAAPRPAAEARAAVQKGDLTAYVVVPEGFGAAGLAAAQPPRVEIGVDPAQPASAGLLSGVVVESTFAALAATDPEAARALLPLLAPRVAVIDVAPEGARPASGFEIMFPSGILWGILGCISTFSVSLVVERTRGTWQRLRVAPLSRAQLLAGKALACFVAVLAVIASVMLVAKLFFAVRVVRPDLLALGAVCTAVCFVGLMQLLSTLGKTESAVAGASWGAFMPMMMLGGGMIPLIAMPAWMQTASHVSPAKWGIVALEGAIWRDYGLGDMLLPCAVLLAVGVLAFAAGATIMARSDG